MPKLLIASIPRSGRGFISATLRKLGVNIKLVEGPAQIDDDVQVVFTHDFNLDLYLPDRYIIRLQRNPEECLRSWFLLDSVVSREGKLLPSTKETYQDRRELQLPYLLGFNHKYRFSRTIGFNDILERPNTVLEEICYIVKHPFTPLDIPKHTPRNLNIPPFV